MESSTSKIKIEIDGVEMEYQYSGGWKCTEFCYRWKLASLTHDIGYGVSLFENDETKMIAYIQKFGVTSIHKLTDLWLFGGTDLRIQLQYMQEKSIIKYMENQYEAPLHGSVYYDHGIISSLIFLRCMKQEYAKHSDNSTTMNGNTHIIWDKRILFGSIRQVAIAIAYHNLDSEKLKSSADNVKIFDLEKYPLLWLLKVCDIMQEWDKPKVMILHEKTDDSSINISFGDDIISVKNFPESFRENVQDTISNYTNPSNLIEIIDT
ncbi:MAG: hypothetical protein GQ533_01730 [Methanosarcinaceae archaeon]|nr:hypothetical protein [Methanosarcinaceae archaeon]